VKPNNYTMNNHKIESREALFAQMSNGGIVITPNNRLSNQLLHDFLEQQDGNVYDKPRCLPYQAFLHDLFKQVRHRHPHLTHPTVLTQAQQRLLWQKILNQQPENTAHEGLLHEIQEAWTRCRLWEIDKDHTAFKHNPQTGQFQEWQDLFYQQLNTLGAITEEQLANYLLPFIGCLIQAPMIWACFDDYTPQQRRLQQALQTQGCLQYHHDFAPKPITTVQYIAKDGQDEWMQIIYWLNQRLVAGDRRIGVVVPDLQSRSSQLQRLLLRHLPHDQFSISLGESLADYQLVSHALNWLNLEGEVISNHQVRLLLHSPYLAGAKSEFTKRAQLMQESKLLQEAVAPWPSFIKECQRAAPELALLLSDLSDYPLQASPKEWVIQFKTRLNQLGFPGEYPLNSATYQCFQRFVTLIDELLQLSVITPVMSKSQALDCLRQLAKTTIFQVRKSTSPIQILGLLEASGCTFDSVWICGLTDQCLPQKTNFCAFIPIDLQREQQMPHADPARELQFARQLLKRLQHGSGISIFSYPRLLGDMPNMPSPLICELPELTSEHTPPPTTSLLIPREETYCVGFTSGEKASGGTALLANQAKCPFRSFATHRLHAKRGPDVSTGPDPSERGQLMHKVMDKLWQSLGSQQRLLVLGEEQLEQYIEQAITSAMSPMIQQRVHSFSPLVQEVELNRLKLLVHACLAWERQRPPFEVEALEKEFTHNLAGIDFRVRVDRLDRIGDKKWVIDYKSSLPTHKPWYDDRPEEPQLLLYALLDETINALLFLQLKTGHLTCSGLSEESLPIKGISALKKNEQWQDLQQHWNRQLSHLANEFVAGHCPPEPSRENICQQCDFQSLCRIELV